MNSRFLVPIVFAATLVGCGSKPLAIRTQFQPQDLHVIEAAVNPKFNPTPSTLVAKIPKECSAGSSYREDGHGLPELDSNGFIFTSDNSGISWEIFKMADKSTVALKEIYSGRPMRQGQDAVTVGDWKGYVNVGEVHTSGVKSTSTERRYYLYKDNLSLRLRVVYKNGDESAMNRAIEAAECFARTMKVIPTSSMFPGQPQDTSHTADLLDREFHKIGSTGPI